MTLVVGQALPDKNFGVKLKVGIVLLDFLNKKRVKLKSINSTLFLN